MLLFASIIIIIIENLRIGIKCTFKNRYSSCKQLHLHEHEHQMRDRVSTVHKLIANRRRFHKSSFSISQLKTGHLNTSLRLLNLFRLHNSLLTLLLLYNTSCPVSIKSNRSEGNKILIGFAFRKTGSQLLEGGSLKIDHFSLLVHSC